MTQINFDWFMEEFLEFLDDLIIEHNYDDDTLFDYDTMCEDIHENIVPILKSQGAELFTPYLAITIGNAIDERLGHLYLDVKED